MVSKISRIKECKQKYIMNLTYKIFQYLDVHLIRLCATSISAAESVLAVSQAKRHDAQEWQSDDTVTSLGQNQNHLTMFSHRLSQLLKVPYFLATEEWNNYSIR